jgi:LCP family protein required for cell wall assembly
MSPLPPTRERPVSITPPELPGDLLTASPAPARRRWLRRVGIVLIVSLAVLLGAVAAAMFYVRGEINDLVTPKTAEMRATQKQLTAPLPNRPTNIMLLGSDHRKTTGDEDKRSDTLMVVRLDPKRKTISIMSFPRDLYVPIPGHGEAKLNEAYYIGGPELAVKTVKEFTGLDINMVMNVDFDGFRGVVNQLGGVWVDVDRTYFDNVANQSSDIDLKPGYQLLRGEQALQYARFRHDTRGDFNRIARQQQVIAGLKKQVASSSLAKNVPGLFRVFSHNAEVVAGGGNSIDARVLYDYLRLALTLDHKDVYEIEYDGLTGEASNGASIVVYDEDKMDEAVAAFLAPNAKARDKTADQLVGKQTKAEAPGGTPQKSTTAEPEEPAAPAPSTVSVKVLNGSGVSGAAGKMAQSLSAAGYRVDPAQSNADAQTYASTKVFYATEEALPAARAMADGIEGATVGPKDGSNAFTTQLLVVVGDNGTTFSADGAEGTIGGEDGPDGGSTYDGNVVPEKGDAHVTPDLESAREQFFDVELTKLPVMIPQQREESSSYEEAYAYQFSRGEKGSQTVYDAYRLVAKTANGDYWGIQGMTWHDPPILEGPTREVTRRGRTYRLYFNGTRLHMVAWRQGPGTYWLSNSVLNNLSNETMLAIAESTRLMR